MRVFSDRLIEDQDIELVKDAIEEVLKANSRRGSKIKKSSYQSIVFNNFIEFNPIDSYYDESTSKENMKMQIY
jgi:hypothetical protein